MGLRIGPLALDSFETAAALLATCGLPSEDLRESAVDLIGAWRGSDLVGCIGAQPAGPDVLVRSLAVVASGRGRGIARLLYDRMLVHLARRGYREAYVLTATAVEFFARRGFVLVDRREAPEAVERTAEFRTLCPETASLMRRALREAPLVFRRDWLELRQAVEGARYLALSLEKASLSYFEVEPHARFPRHVHESEQLTLVLEGRLVFRFEGREVVIEPGEAVAIPAGTPHEVSVVGDQRVRAVDAWGPARSDF